MFATETPAVMQVSYLSLAGSRVAWLPKQQQKVKGKGSISILMGAGCIGHSSTHQAPLGGRHGHRMTKGALLKRKTTRHVQRQEKILVLIISCFILWEMAKSNQIMLQFSDFWSIGFHDGGEREKLSLLSLKSHGFELIQFVQKKNKNKFCLQSTVLGVFVFLWLSWQRRVFLLFCREGRHRCSCLYSHPESSVVLQGLYNYSGFPPSHWPVCKANREVYFVCRCVCVLLSTRPCGELAATRGNREHWTRQFSS